MEIKEKQPSEPLFNVPPATMAVFVALLAIHIARRVVPDFEIWAVEHWTLVPKNVTTAPWTLVTHGLLHFGWLHFFLNGTGLLAFGAGVERFYGRGWMLGILIGGVLGGALAHLALFASSEIPLGGASAGVSALFGAILPLITRTRRTLINACAVFILMNMVLGMIGMPDDPGVSIAWQAHLGGFAIGLLAARLKFRAQKNPGR